MTMEKGDIFIQNYTGNEVMYYVGEKYTDLMFIYNLDRESGPLIYITGEYDKYNILVTSIFRNL